MNDIDRMSMETELMGVKYAKGNLQLKIAKLKNEIIRLDENVVIQDNKIDEIETKLKGE